MLLTVGIILLAIASARADSPATQPAPAAAVVNPWVTTDRSIDTSTVDNILKGLIRKDMTDEQKVLAVYNWIRRVIYHGDGPVKYAYDFSRMINVYGHGSCLRQTTPMWVLLDRLGYKCRTGAVDGHHIIEVYYGDAWHVMDPHMNFYVYDRATPRAIASIEQIKADPSLVDDAVKEGRACPGFLLCGDKPATFSKGKFTIIGEFPESKKYTPVIDEPFGRITLRRGETYVRTWMPGEHWFKANAPHKDRGPDHGCGLKADSQDTPNWPIYEPHTVNRKCRHWGEGYLIYKPDLASGHYLDAAVGKPDVAITKVGDVVTLSQGTPGMAGEIIFSVNCPYVITAGELKFDDMGSSGVNAAVSTDQGKTWKPVTFTSKDGHASGTFVDEVNGGLAGYWLKLTLTGGHVAALELKTHFQINPYSLPYLAPGRNEVSVAGDAFGSPLKVEWTYAEGPDWKENKTAAQTFTKPGKFVIDVGGEKYPRNVSLSLSVAP
jgi:hypothetical protein